MSENIDNSYDEQLKFAAIFYFVFAAFSLIGIVILLFMMNFMVPMVESEVTKARQEMTQNQLHESHAHDDHGTTHNPPATTQSNTNKFSPPSPPSPPLPPPFFNNNYNGPDEKVIADFMKIIFSIILTFSIISFVLNVIAGIALLQRKWYILCMIVSALTCLSFPLGTALGVWTIILLLKDPVKSQFNDRKLSRGTSYN